ncbi:MAG TPA: hypothetical protein VLL05_04775 [Terriglobales bacterium]|nr:hypothetical protein [Terriglobales bacterium]
MPYFQTRVATLMFVTCAFVVNIPVLAADKEPTKLTCNGKADPSRGGSPLSEISIEATIDYASGKSLVVLEDDKGRHPEIASTHPTYVYTGTIRKTTFNGPPFRMLWTKTGLKEDFNGVAIYPQSADVLRIDTFDYEKTGQTSFQFFDGFWGILYKGVCTPTEWSIR